VKFGENDQLFGFDSLHGIVAVEFAEPDAVDVFVRAGDGPVTIQRQEFRPYLWTAEETDGTEELAGDLPLKYRQTFATWQEYTDARGDLQKSGVETFSFNDPVQQYLTASGRTLFKGLHFEDLRRMQLATEATTDNLLAIALSDQSGWEEVQTIPADNAEAERAALEWLTTQIQQRDPDVLEGHNLFKITLPFLVARAKKLKVRLAWGRAGEPLTSRPSRLQIAEKTIQYPKFVLRGRHLVDTWVLAQYYDVSSRELESFDLPNVARHFGIEHAGESLTHRVREVRALAATLSRSYFIQAQIFPYNYQDVIIRGNATKIDALFVREYYRRNHALPSFPESRHFEGGYTAIFQTGVIENVWHCDVTSLYPSVMLSFGFLPEADQLDVFRGLLTELRTFRVAAKAEMRKTADPIERAGLDALQNTFKILINSFYGYLGFAQGHFADFDAAEKVTARGREILRQMVDWLEKKSAKVIEIDTDGIYFHPPTGASESALQAELTAELPAGIDVEFDQRYRAMFSYKAKNYALLEEDGSVTIKGAALKSRGMEPFLRDYLGQFVRLLLEGRVVEAASLRDKVAGEIRSRKLPITVLAKTEALQDSLTNYQKKITASSRNRSAAFELALKSGRNYQAGDQVTYYVTGTKKKVTAYENARLVEEWNPEARDENVEYYVGKLEDLAAKFAEFSRGGEELTLL